MWKISLRYIPLKANEWIIGPAYRPAYHTHLCRTVASYGKRAALIHDGLPVFSVENFKVFIRKNANFHKGSRLWKIIECMQMCNKFLSSCLYFFMPQMACKKRAWKNMLVHQMFRTKFIHKIRLEIDTSKWQMNKCKP